MNLLILVVSSEKEVNEREKTRIMQIMRNGTGQLHIELMNPDRPHKNTYNDVSDKLRDKIKTIDTMISLQPSQNLPVIEEAL
jgi:hypothetical protein